MQCHGSGKKRAFHLKQAIGSGILPPDAWHAALPESNTVNHFKKEFFLRKKITLFLQKPKLHLVHIPPSFPCDTITENNSRKYHGLTTRIWRKWWICMNGRSKYSTPIIIKSLLPRAKISHISNSRLGLVRFQY